MHRKKQTIKDRLQSIEDEMEVIRNEPFELNVLIPNLHKFSLMHLSNEQDEDVDRLVDMFSKYDKNDTQHLMALAYYWYKQRLSSLEIPHAS
jgi:hypothetical protein